MTAQFSRPGLRPLWTLLLRGFVRDGQVSIHYKQGSRPLCALIRMADEQGDLHSVLEVVVRQTYPLDPSFDPGIVIDGGANVGLFTLQAAAVYPRARIVMCEPLARNIAQLKRHMEVNHVEAELLPCCLGGVHRAIPFYCREANASSFDPKDPYTSIEQIDVLTLKDILETRPAEKVLIKLDIEGMEIEALQAFVPGERRAVLIYGELHGHRQHRPAIERLFTDHGWSVQFGDPGGDDILFEARSPAAR